MDKTQIILALIGSAAIGALVSSAITLIGQHIERRWRREELLLTKAVEMAHWRFETVMQIARETNTNATFLPEIELARDYHGYLTSLLRTGKLPPEYKRMK